jgi:hypothetical protein
MPEELCRLLLDDFLNNSWPSVKTVVEKLAGFGEKNRGKSVTFFRFRNGQRINSSFGGTHFFLRSSVEYSNPQLTVEELQGIIGARLLEVCGNYFHEYGLREPNGNDFAEMCERLKEPPEGVIVAFLLNTDDTEPDRYSMNPLKESILSTGQSAFPAANVKTENLTVDQQFVKKYEGTLISRGEAELIGIQLADAKGSYLDFVDSVKYAQLETLSEVLGFNLSLYALRMPLSMLRAEANQGLLHQIISETHRNFEAVKQAYDCMGRSITKRTTLLTVPHSKMGYGSKRAARGKLRFDGDRLESVTVKYKTTQLYPNAIDPADVSIAKAEDNLTVTGEKLADYSFAETPSSPQFFLYSLGSPENAALWHGIGAFASPQLLQSYASVRGACRRGRMMESLEEKYGVESEVPTQFNLSPTGMWVHPVHRNIDASVGCVENIADLVKMGMKIDHISRFK